MLAFRILTEIASEIFHSLERTAGVYQFVDVLWSLWLTGHFHCLFFSCSRVRDGDGDYSLNGAIVFDIQNVVRDPLQPEFPFAVMDFVGLV